LRRYLTAREGNVDAAEAQLRASAQWRHETKPHLLDAAEFAADIAMRKMFFMGHDNHRRPVVVFRPGRDQIDAGTLPDKVRYFVFVNEIAISRMAPDVEQMTWLVDFTGYNVSHRDVKKLALARALIETLQAHYPERVARMVVASPPWYFRLLLAVVKPFVSERTLAKVVFAHPAKKGERGGAAVIEDGGAGEGEGSGGAAGGGGYHPMLFEMMEGGLLQERFYNSDWVDFEFFKIRGVGEGVRARGKEVEEDEFVDAQE
jgi:hypothetical protein